MANYSLCLGIAVTAISFSIVATTATTNSTSEVPDQDISCLAANVYHEARGESLRGQRAVADVTLNRVDSRSWPNTLCQVVWQRKQFSWTHDHLSDEMRDADAREVAYRIAWEALNEPRTNDATHYHATYTKPYWANSLEYIETIGLHKFYK